MKKYKHIYALVVFLSLCASISAQTWEQYYDLDTSIFGQRIMIEPDGEMIVFAGAGDFTTHLIKLAPNGDTIWTKVNSTGRFIAGAYPNSDGTFTAIMDDPVLETVIKTFDGDANLLSLDGSMVSVGFQDPIRTSSGTFVFPKVFDGLFGFASNGDTVFYHPSYRDADSLTIYLESVAESSDGYIFSGRAGFITPSDIVIGKTDYSGNLLWTKTVKHPTLEEKQSYVAVDGNDDIYVAHLRKEAGQPNKAILKKFDATGTELWEKEHIGETPRALCFNTGAAYMWTNANNSLLRKYESNGDLSLIKNFGPQANTGVMDMDCSEDAGFVAFTGGLFGAAWTSDVYAARVDPNATSDVFLLQGTVFGDNDMDCVVDGDEIPLEGTFIVAENAADTFHAKVEVDGSYRAYLNEGSYDVRLSNQKYPYHADCAAGASIQGLFQDTVVHDVFANATIICPSMWVDASRPYLVPGWISGSKLRYCNNGSADAMNSVLTVNLPNIVTYHSSSVVPSSVSGGQVQFDLGDVPYGDCGEIQLYFSVIVDSSLYGQTFAMQTHITPDTLCTTPNPLWSGASNRVGLICTGDSVRMFVTNAGNAPNATAFDYIVLEDNVIMKEGMESLSPSDTLWLTAEANGSTYRITATQEPHHPGQNQPTAAIEACLAGSAGTTSLGFIDQFPENDADAFVDIDNVVYMATPPSNSKTASPLGFGADNLIENETALEYTIHFQNTSPDIVQTVDISDVLSENLDLESLVMGAGSHPFSWEIAPNRTLKVYFRNLNLVSSTTDEQNSLGFISYKIKPKSDLAIGTEINNTADIKMGGNLSFQTETVHHQIGKNFVSVAAWTPQKNTVHLDVFPNPTQDFATFQISGTSLSDARYELFSMDGKLAKSGSLNGNQAQISVQSLEHGMYLFRLFDEKGLIGVGKVLVGF